MDQQKEPHPLYMAARTLFSRLELSVAEVAWQCGLEEEQIDRWIQAAGWEKLRQARTVSKVSQIDHLYQLLYNLSLQLSDGADTDIRTVDLMLKYSAIIKNLENGNSLHQFIELGEQFTTWLFKRDEVLARQFGQQFDAFIEERAAA